MWIFNLSFFFNFSRPFLNQNWILEGRGWQFFFSINMSCPLWWLNLQWNFFQVHHSLLKTFSHASIKEQNRIYHFLYYDDKNVFIGQNVDLEPHVWVINLQMDFLLNVKVMLLPCDISCQYSNIDGHQHFPQHHQLLETH